MSDYYARGRAIIADATSLAFFILGFLGAGPLAWPALRASFESGVYDRGLGVFIARLFASGIAAGLFGLILGTLAGRLWQSGHQWRRARRQPSAGAAPDTPGAAMLEQVRAADAPAESRAPLARRSPAAMTCRSGALSPSVFATFAGRRGGGADDRRYVESRTTEILTLVAWDGLDVAGVARVLTDGYGAHFITDFAVDPHYVAAEVEETLVEFARSRVPPGGRLTRV